MKLITIISFLILSSASFANETNNSINSMLGIQDKVSEMEIPTQIIHKAKYPIGTCLIYKMENESYWKMHEAPTYMIESIGNNSYKTKKIIADKKGRWIKVEDMPKPIEYRYQDQFYKSECPDPEKRSKYDPKMLEKKR